MAVSGVLRCRGGRLLSAATPRFEDGVCRGHVGEGARAGIASQGLPFPYTCLQKVELDARTRLEVWLDGIEHVLFSVSTADVVKRRDPRVSVRVAGAWDGNGRWVWEWGNGRRGRGKGRCVWDEGCE